MNKIILILMGSIILSCAQKSVFNISKVQSHNDYEKLNTTPFTSAYKLGIGYIEADIFLVDNQLYVAHEEAIAKRDKKTLSSLYLKPLEDAINNNKGKAYTDYNLNLLIDIKTEAKPTITKLIGELELYPSIINAKNLTIIISGNRGDINDFSNYPAFIKFDGRLTEQYDKKSLAKIALISDNVNKFSTWHKDHTGPLSEEDNASLQKEIKRIHELGKPIRFWNTPETAVAWRTLMDLGVDVIGTDHIYVMKDFLDNQDEEPDFKNLSSLIAN